MYFKLEPERSRFEGVSPDSFWLRDDKDRIISFRDKDAAEHFRRMIEGSEAYLRVLPSVEPARLHAHLCEFDNTGYVIQLTAFQMVIPDSGIIELSRSHL